MWAHSQLLLSPTPEQSLPQGSERLCWWGDPFPWPGDLIPNEERDSFGIHKDRYEERQGMQNVKVPRALTCLNIWPPACDVVHEGCETFRRWVKSQWTTGASKASAFISQPHLLSIILCFLSAEIMQPTSFLLLLPRLPWSDVTWLLLPAEAVNTVTCALSWRAGLHPQTQTLQVSGAQEELRHWLPLPAVMLAATSQAFYMVGGWDTPNRSVSQK